jgi:preprotein translocase subunit SecY
VFQTIRNAWKIDDIRKKFVFTLFILLLYRLGNAVPVPFIDVSALSEYFQQMQSNTVLGLYNVMSGSSFSQGTIFALSIQPYINASIIIQLLTIAIPALERLQKEGGEEGKKKLERVTRYSTLLIALIQGFAYYTLIKSGTNGTSMLMPEATGIWPMIVIIGSFTAGSCLLMWMGEQITEFGIGNGISIILFVSIVSRFPNQLYTSIQQVASGQSVWWHQVLLLLGVLVIIVMIIIVTQSERRIPVQYAKRVVGRKMYGGQSTHLPMKVNMSGVMPIIFAQSIASLPATIASFVPAWKDKWIVTAFNTNSWIYAVVYFLLIIFFAYFYSTIQFNPIEVANNLKKNGGFIPGFRPGKPTSEYIQKVLGKVTLFGALYLSVVAIAPLIVSKFMPDYSKAGISFGGTSVIIVVGVALETMKQVEAQMLMRHYKGFLE